MAAVKVVSIESAGYYTSEYANGSTVKVTLGRDNERVSCDGILIWEEEYMGDDMFYEWRECAEAGEEGYAYWRE